MVWSLSQLAEHVEARVVGDPNYTINKVATLQNADAQSISFLANSKYRKFLRDCCAGAVIVTQDDIELVNGNALLVKDAYVAYAKIAQLMYPAERHALEGIHSSAVVDASAQIASSASIGAQCVIGPGVTIEANVQIGPGCIIGRDVTVAADSQLIARVTLCHQVKIGKRVIIHPGVVIGADGFGLANDDGQWIKVPQVGSVHIDDDVEIGANTTIDRGAIEDTYIGIGVKLDNQIQIGHNVFIGEHTVIAGCVGIAGSTRIGRYCAIGGGSGINGHIEITDAVQLTGMSMVTKSITEPGAYSSGIPIVPSREWQKNVIRYRQLEKLHDRVTLLETTIKK